MEKLNIAVIGGGDSAEFEISVLSQGTVLENLPAEYNSYKVMLVDGNWWVEQDSDRFEIDLNDFSFTEEKAKTKFDFAFIVIHGTPGEDGLLQGYLDLMKVPYNTPDQMASTLTFNKWACNHLLRSLGYNCAKSILIRNREDADQKNIVDTLGLPVFVKPNDGGSSFGVSKVKVEGDLKSAIDEAFSHGAEVIIEESLEGIEVTCGVITNSKNEVMAFPITEIVSENEFFDYEAKYKGLSKEITPARLDDNVYSQVQKITEQVYRDLGLKGMSRVDFIVVDNEPFVMEINTTPGLSPESIIPQQANHINMSLEELFSTVIKQSLI